MSITDELRTGGIYRFPSNRRVFTEEELTAIADRIDAEHEAACAEAYGNGVMSVPIALDESQWVKLPVDADGVPIHVGDVMEWCDSGDTLTVEGIGKDIVFYIDNGGAEWTAAMNKRHHKPTVEDVLCELLDKVDDDRAGQAEIIAEYAAKLSMAKEGE